MTAFAAISLDNPLRVGLNYSASPHSPVSSFRRNFGRSDRVAPNLLGLLGTTPPSKLAAPTLPEGCGSVSEIPSDWFAIHARIDGGSRDAALAWALFLGSLPFYYPVAEIAVWEGQGESRRRRKKRVSLFDGYVFGAGDDCRKFCRENPDLIESTISEPRKGQLRGELLIVEAALKADPRLKTRDVSMPGARVRVTRGPWMNKEGKVEPNREGNLGPTQVWLPLEIMGRLVPIAVDTSDLELLD